MALTGVDLDITRGSVHALVGENGAGKSTCLGIIAGRTSASAGSVTVNGTKLGQGDPRAALAAGVAAVYQELSLLPKLTAHENVFLSNPLTRGGMLSQRRMRNEYEKVCAELGVAASPDVPTGELPVASQQLTEIIRAIASNADVLLLDEPTASLPIEERAALFRLIERLKENGTTIVWVSHNLAEVLANSDTVTVFRDGRLMETRPASDWTHEDLIARMLGESNRQMMLAESEHHKPAEQGQGPSDGPLLRVSNLTIPGRVDDVSFTVDAGEVIGIAGLMGAGRTSLMRAIAGLEPTASGEVQIGSTLRPVPTSPRVARKMGIGFVPEDRKTQGISLLMSCADNVTLSDFGRVSVMGYLSPRRARAVAKPPMTRAGVLANKLAVPAGTLSGGNQQKLLLARMQFQQPIVLLADEPTRGIDVHAKTEILTSLREKAQREGIAVVLVSSELEELIAFCDRIIVLRHGAVSGVLANQSDRKVAEGDILRFAFEPDRSSS